ncbi:MAG: RluA family pseudouridine synthase, partial [Bacteroidota bacterium]
SMGHPLLADPIYSKKEAFYLSQIKHRQYRLGKNQEERPLLHRTALHATRLSFQHPLTNEQMELHTELPKDIAAVIRQLQKWSRL